MTLKTKITLGFAAELLLGGGGRRLYAVRCLGQAAASVPPDNFSSGQLGQLAPAQQQLYLAGAAPASYEATVQRSLRQFRRSLAREAGNIAPELPEKIVQRFTQLPSQGGSGLGLSIAREFMASQGGQLGVESELGKGSTFLVTLPVRLAAPAKT